MPTGKSSAISNISALITQEILMAIDSQLLH